MASEGITIENVPLVDGGLTGEEKIPASNGTKKEVAVSVDQIASYASNKVKVPKLLKDLESDSQHRTVTDEDIKKWNSGTGGGGSPIEYNKPMPSVSISGTWTFFNSNDGQVSPSQISPVPNSTNPTLEFGYKAQFRGTYKWKSGTDTKAPTGVTSDSTFRDLPADGVNSSVYESSKYLSGGTITAAVQAPKTGLIVSNGSVQPATGNDVARASVSVSFRHRLYYGKVTSSTVDEQAIKGLSNKLVSSRGGRIDGVRTSVEEYFVYAYPQSLGMLSSIEQDGKYAVIGAFVDPPATVNVTNAAGMATDYYVYVTKNKGAFPDNFLVFI